MSLLKKWGKAVDSKNRDTMDECLHEDYKFKNYSQGKIISKREKIRILYENEEVGVEHSFVSFGDGNRQAVLAFFTFKDGKIYTVETGATNLK